jgi:hypothetical protein
MQVDPGELHWSIWLRFGVSLWMMMSRLLAYTSLLDYKQGRNIIIFSSMSEMSWWFHPRPTALWKELELESQYIFCGYKYRLSVVTSVASWRIFLDSGWVPRGAIADSRERQKHWVSVHVIENLSNTIGGSEMQFDCCLDRFEFSTSWAKDLSL